MIIPKRSVARKNPNSFDDYFLLFIDNKGLCEWIIWNNLGRKIWFVVSLVVVIVVKKTTTFERIGHGK